MLCRGYRRERKSKAGESMSRETVIQPHKACVRQVLEKEKKRDKKQEGEEGKE